MRLLQYFRMTFTTMTIVTTACMATAIQAAPPEEITAKVALGLEMSAVPTPVTEALEAALDATALAQWFCDPETCRERPNYKAAAKIVVPAAEAVTVAALKRGFDGPVSTVTAAQFTVVLKAQLLIAADELAFRETLHRQYTAERNKDKKAAALQDRTLKSLLRKTMADKASANSAWRKLAQHLKESAIESKPTDAAATLAMIKERGFPPRERALFKDLGLSPSEIDQIQKIVLENIQLSKVPSTFSAVVPGITKINENHATMQQCQCAPPQ